MKEYVKQIIAEGERLLAQESVSESDIESFDRHIAYCCHERLVHLLVTLTFALLTIITLFIALEFEGMGTLLLFVIFAVMTAAYAWHYYFLENSVQKLYITADNIRKK